MKRQTKKLIAPIVITVFLVVYFIFYLWAGLTINGMSVIMKILLIGFLIGLIGLSIYMLIERIGEIREGEEDDLSKY